MTRKILQEKSEFLFIFKIVKYVRNLTTLHEQQASGVMWITSLHFNITIYAAIHAGEIFHVLCV